jgi:DNA-binding winged helix-turn-helix (wHTH) protein
VLCEADPVTFVFGDVELDPDRLELRSNGRRLALEPQAFDVLLYLVRHRDRVVAKEELMDQVWGGRFVSETAVTSRIKQVRRVLGDDGQHQSHIRTYHARGYRFVCDVVEVAGPIGSRASSANGSSADTAVAAAIAAADGADAAARADQQTVETPVLTCGSGSRTLRFQLSGQGPPDLLVLPATTSLTEEWSRSGRARLLDGLGAIARVIRCEPPLSGPTAADDPPGVDTGDLLAVLDAAASERAVILAEGTAAVLAAQLATGCPERVAGLVVFGASVGHHEGGADLPTLFGSVAAPSLVLHRAGDPVVPIARARALAAWIPDAEFVPLTGEDHLAEGDPEQVLAAVAGLVGDVAAEQAADQHLTALVGIAGEDADALVSVLEQLGGRRRRGPQGSVIVSFEGPANALRALASRRARGLLSEVGVGLAIDEVSRDSFLVSGHGVDVARLFARNAAPGEVLLPNVVKHLLAGSGLKVQTLTPLDLPHVGLHPVHRWVQP